MVFMTHGITAYMDPIMEHIGDIPIAIATGIMEEVVIYPTVTIPQGIMAQRVEDQQRQQVHAHHIQEGLLLHPMAPLVDAQCQEQLLILPTTLPQVVPPIRVAAVQASVATGLLVHTAPHQVIAPHQVAEAVLQAIALAVPAQVAASEAVAVAPVVASAVVEADAPAVAAAEEASVAADNQRILSFY